MDDQKQAWASNFDERQQKEIALDVLYAKEFAHGTDGHNSKMIIAKMAALLTEQEQALADLGKHLSNQEDARTALQRSLLANIGK